MNLRNETSDTKASALVHRLWREDVRPYWSQLILLGGAVVLTALATSAYPLVMKRTFDAISNKEFLVIWFCAMGIVVATAVKGFSLLAQTKLTNRLVTRIETNMQIRLYHRLLDADIGQLSRETVASLTQRFTTDFGYLNEALARFVNILLRDSLTAVALVAAMLWFDWRLTLICLACAILFAVPIGRLGRKMRKFAGDTQAKTGSMASMVAESLSGIRVAKTYNLESYLKARTAAAFEQIRNLRMKGANARSRLDPWLEMGAGSAIAGVLLFVGLRISRGEATVGDFMGFVTALFLAAQPIRAIGNLSTIMQEAAAALQRIYRLMDQRPTIIDSPDAKKLEVTKGRLVFEGIHFRYRDDVPALEGVDLVAEGGETTAIVGRSGSGKSTLIAMPPRLFDPQAGRILIDGVDISTVTLESLRAAIAVVSQDVVLFNDTIRANIALGRPGATESEIIAAAKAAAAHDFISALPEGYDSQIGERGGKLSGGERQRIALARAFLKNAPILLLDEATSSLDTESERLVQEALNTLMKGRTSIVIAHRLSTVRNADKIVVMESGRVIETGRHETLMANPMGAYARLQGAQLFEDEKDGASIIRVS